jgi:hypothetical protein
MNGLRSRQVSLSVRWLRFVIGMYEQLPAGGMVATEASKLNEFAASPSSGGG